MKRIIKFGLLLSIMSLLVGCAGTISQEQMMAETANYAPPIPEKADSSKATVYVVRPAGVGALIRFNVFVDDPSNDAMEAGYTRGGQHIYFQLAPGNHQIYSKAENTANIPLNALPGKSYYIQQVPTMGFIMARNDLFKLSELEGKYYLKKTSIGTIKKSILP